jgi:transcriptional regulator with XRE-family HTH domain
MSQRTLADLIGTMNGRISQYESGAIACTVDTLGKLALALDVPASDFFDETDFDEPSKRRKKR